MFLFLYITGHHSAPKCPQVMTRSGEATEMKLLEHEIWNHGDVCYDPTRSISCPKGCSPSNESGSEWLYCDMRWPRLTLYKEENGKEKRYPCRVPEGRLTTYSSIVDNVSIFCSLVHLINYE